MRRALAGLAAAFLLAGCVQAQGGAPDSRLRNVKGTLSMARTAEPDSATTHVFVNLVDNTRLDYDGSLAPGYAVFGNVTSGWDAVEAIAATPVLPSAQGCEGRPVPTMETAFRSIRASR